MKKLYEYIQRHREIAKSVNAEFKYYVMFTLSLLIFQSIVVSFVIYIFLTLLYKNLFK